METLQFGCSTSAVGKLPCLPLESFLRGDKVVAVDRCTAAANLFSSLAVAWQHDFHLINIETVIAD